MKNYTKYTALITSSLLAVVLAGPASAAPPMEVSRTTEVSVSTEAPIVVSANAVLPKNDSPVVTTAPYVAPVPVAAPVAPQAVAPKAPAAPVQQVPAAPAPTKAPASAPVAPKPVAAPPVAGNGAGIAAAAIAQVGVPQDCTRLVTNALARSVGINHHGWPISYMSLGRVVTDPQAGDLIYYDNAGAGVPHIAVYIGGGKAVHGGWNGTTSIQSAYLGSGPVFIRVVQ